MKKLNIVGLIIVTFIIILTAGCGRKSREEEESIRYMKRFFPASQEYNEDNINFHFTELYDNGKIDQTILIDTRSKEEYDKGHLCGAVNAVLDKDFAMELLKHAPDDDHVLIYGNESDLENNKKFAKLLRDIRWVAAYHITVPYDNLAAIDWMKKYIETESHELGEYTFDLWEEEVAKVDKYFE